MINFPEPLRYTSFPGNHVPANGQYQSGQNLTGQQGMASNHMVGTDQYGMASNHMVGTDQYGMASNHMVGTDQYGKASNHMVGTDQYGKASNHMVGTDQYRESNTYITPKRTHTYVNELQQQGNMTPM
ncbi:uncharacterized protein LOC117324511 [Pecten maximus]|uniref:uncharacterized protein LOC117324511 n=1 Tax=Pecten maximus TaxID=6579 RepID=UPI001458E644|nr:uncharacterized protein LOC117324511 [Pecten maximus]